MNNLCFRNLYVIPLGGIVDMPTITFIIIDNDRYKKFGCFDPWDAVNICTDIKADQNVLDRYKAIGEKCN